MATRSPRKGSLGALTLREETSLVRTPGDIPHKVYLDLRRTLDNVKSGSESNLGPAVANQAFPDSATRPLLATSTYLGTLVRYWFREGIRASRRLS